MSLKTYPTTVKDGKLYAEVSLRTIVEHADVSDLPMLAEVKRLYDENDALRELVWDMVRWMPCPMSCRACERYRYPDGCEFDIRRKELGVVF